MPRNESGLFVAGDKWIVKDTERARNGGLEVGGGGFITFVDDHAVSIELLQRGMPHLRILREDFGLNFHRALDGLNAPAYRGQRHAERAWP